MRERFSSASDVEFCRRIHQKFGKTYYYATRRFPADVRWRVHGIYAFVRVPDEWVDNPGDLSVEDRLAKLSEWRQRMEAGMQGVKPDHPALRVFCDAVAECGLPLDEAHCFLDAMEADLTVARYGSYEDLRGYMRGSASAIGVMMSYAMGAQLTDDTLSRAKALGEAMQLTNFLRDIREDLERGRIYLPASDMAEFGITENDLRTGHVTAQFRELMRFEIARARSLYAYSDAGICTLPPHARRAVLMARILYAQILDAIEAIDYDVFRHRARTSMAQKALCAFRVAVQGHHLLSGHVGHEADPGASA